MLRQRIASIVRALSRCAHMCASRMERPVDGHGASQHMSTLDDDDAYEGGSVASGDPQSSLNYPPPRRPTLGRELHRLVHEPRKRR